MENIVAVAIKLDTGQNRYFLTWGRIFDSVDGSRLESLALKAASQVKLVGTAVSAHLCDSLQEAAEQPYFYEAFFAMSQRAIPFGEEYEAWRQERESSMTEGRDWWFLGVPK